MGNVGVDVLDRAAVVERQHLAGLDPLRCAPASGGEGEAEPRAE